MINKTRTFSANVGDKSIGNAGPDAIEHDIDNMMTNQPWNDEVIKIGRTDEYIPTTDYSPATKRYVDLHASVISHAVPTNDYGLATKGLYGHVKVIDDLTKTTYADGEALSAHQGKAIVDLMKNSIITGTYTGDDAASRNIELGFRPKAIFISNKDGQSTMSSDVLCGGFAYDGSDTPAITITETGFRIYYDGTKNQTNTTYNSPYKYIALKP